jgi:hypothetical protein
MTLPSLWRQPCVPIKHPSNGNGRITYQALKLLSPEQYGCTKMEIVAISTGKIFHGIDKYYSSMIIITISIGKFNHVTANYRHNS